MSAVRLFQFANLLRVSLVAAILSGVEVGALAQTDDAKVGKSLYDAKCSACHSIDANRTGPLHRGVIDRPVASVPGFDYSPVLKRLGGVWTTERLDLWLQNPQAVAPGSAMYFTVDDPVQRRQIIAYLSTLLQPMPRAK